MAMVTISLQESRAAGPQERRRWCLELEAGEILFFPASPIAISADDTAFLLDQQQADSSLHKNIAYKPGRDVLSGIDARHAGAPVERLHGIMRAYSQAVTSFLSEFLAPYAGAWRLDYASFRPQEEEGRDLDTRKRNDLLHTDAFPTRPTHGARILRFFNNVHPDRTRDWIVGDPFGSFAGSYIPGAHRGPRRDAAAGEAQPL